MQKYRHNNYKGQRRGNYNDNNRTNKHDLKTIVQKLEHINEEWILQAITHPSYNVIDRNAIHYQQWEILGDAVIGFICVEQLHELNLTEGQITIAKSSVVNNSTLATIGRKILIPKYARFDKKHTLSDKDLADMVEALFGAIYKSQGLYIVTQLFIFLFNDIVSIEAENAKQNKKKNGQLENNPINILQTYFQKQGEPIPQPKLVKSEGTPENPTFVYCYELTINNKLRTFYGSASNKKEARMYAAGKACRYLRI